MERAGKVIARWKNSGTGVSSEDLARAAWSVAVGKRIAVHTTGIDLVRTHLIVRVDDEIWQRQLWSLRWQILDRLAEVLGKGVVEDLEIRVAPRRIPPKRANAAKPASSDEADCIADPMLRRLYKRKRESA
ncbi:MAG: DUF721 domain-containing protein [bacterium]|nr:DUF721 domain-containing protein [bacterium]